MKLLSLHWGFGFGGVSKYAKVLEAVPDRSPVDIHSVCILMEGRSIDQDTLDSLGSCTVIWITGSLDFSWFKKLQDEVISYSPDVICTHGFNAHFASYLLREDVLSGAHRIVSYHGEYYGSSPLRKVVGVFYDWFTVYFLKRTVLSIAAVAGVCKDYLVAKGVSPEKVTVIHNGIEDLRARKETCSKLRSGWGGNTETRLIGVVSRLEPIKGVRVLIDAFALSVEQFPALRLVIVGDGVQEQELKQHVASLGLSDKVSFAGYRSDIPECIAAFDIYVLPSYREAHSIALLEAMRAGKAIVATDVGGNTESVRPNKDAVVVPPDNPVAMSDGLNALLADPTLLDAFGHSARERFIHHFTVGATVAKTAQWLIDCTANTEHKPITKRELT